jgi:D-sedoheptulose 7-phosphate isomerase
MNKSNNIGNLKIKRIIKDAIDNFSILINNESCIKGIAQASLWIVESFKDGNKLMICGNGGSAADAQHLAGEFMCKFLKNRNPLPALALTTDSSVLTSISNDYSYTDIFSRQVIAIGRDGDVLLGISTSGESDNVLRAFFEAKKLGIRTILLTGNIEDNRRDGVDLLIKVPSGQTPRVQEMHLLVEHIMAELVERELCNND